MRTVLLLVAIACTAGVLSAQGTAQPTPAKESFVIEPGTLKRGAQNATLRLVSNTPSGFSNSSSKPPLVKFSAGVSMVPNSFSILNQNEAECKVNVDNDTFGTIEVSVQLFSVNGTKVLKTLRGTLGITGTQDVQGSSAKVGVEGVLLVRVNVPEAQAAGNIVITGNVNGSVRITSPTGTTFAQAPSVDGGGAEITGARLESSNTVFTFNIGNAGGDDLTVRVSAIRYSTALFGATGGIEGELACEVAGSALSNQSALVVNAFTARSTIEGSNDITEPTATPESQSSDSTDNTNTNSSTGSNAAANANRNREIEDRDRLRRERDREERDRQRRDSGFSGRSSAGQAGASGSRLGGSQGVPRAPNVQGNPNAPQGQPAPAGAQPVSGAGSTDKAVGTGTAGEEPLEPDDAEGESKVQGSNAPKLVTAPGLNFCNKEFEPITAVVLDRIIAGEAGGRVWIELRLPKDRDPEKAETVTVKLTVAGNVRELMLSETSATSGVFRCAKEGVLLLSQENPDSNEPEAAKIPPRARYTDR